MRADIAVPRRPLTRPVMSPSVPAVAAVLVLLELVLGSLLVILESPSFVPRVTFVNPSEYDLSIDSTNDGRDGWVSLVTARRRSTTVLEETFDQGDVWIFRFAGQGRDAGELQTSRRDLERANWTVQVPERIAEELRARGAPPNP